jgi:hypothetical protein
VWASRIDRRSFLKAAGGLGLFGLLPLPRLLAMADAAPAAGQAGLYLTAHQLDALRAVTVRLVPGVAEGEPDAGASEAGCAEAIDALLAAFTFSPPLIHAGGPFSGRAPTPGGAGSMDDFAHFVPLDAQATEGWRIRIEGPTAEQAATFAAGVVGLKQIYTDGLRHLDERAGQLGASNFVSLPAPAQDAILSDQTDPAVQTFVSAALANTLEALYGPPEYRGNRDRVGWKTTNWDGDVQPRGYTPEQVSEPDPAAPTPPLSPREAHEALGKYLVALAGRPAPRDAWWLGRAGFERG